jgi:hypothetical protein
MSQLDIRLLAEHERLTCNVPQSVLTLGKFGIQRFTCFARHIILNVAAQNVLNLFRLESTLDDQSSRAVGTAARTHFSEQERCDVLFASLQTFGNVWEIGKNRLLVSFSETLRRRDLVALSTTNSEIWMTVV